MGLSRIHPATPALSDALSLSKGAAEVIARRPPADETALVTELVF
jgi:hypothetical protein